MIKKAFENDSVSEAMKKQNLKKIIRTSTSKLSKNSHSERPSTNRTLENIKHMCATIKGNWQLIVQE